MQGRVYSRSFDDIYFTPGEGLAEARHVFLQGNNLPESWAGKRRFTVAELGFGTGLNFLAAWALFENTAHSDQSLDYISCERFPLTPGEIREALAEWAGELGPYLEKLLRQYPLRLPGMHRLNLTPRVRLTLSFDDVNEALPQMDIPGGVDAWFLDGFAPAKNPQMWSDTVFREMARLSAPGATVSTFSAARIVRDGLAGAGFAVEKKQGYGRKKDMTVARFGGSACSAVAHNKNPGRIAIIGGGLAGSACAHVLALNGVASTVFEQRPAVPAGGPMDRLAGLYNPRFSARRGPESHYYTSGFALAVRYFDMFQTQTDIKRNACGSLYLLTEDDRRRQLEGTVSSWGWPSENMALLTAEQASAQAGIALGYPALFLPDSGRVSPLPLIRAYLSMEGIDVRAGTGVTAVERQEHGGWLVDGQAFDAVILACGAAVKNFSGQSDLPVHTVRGQASEVAATEESAKLRCNLCFSGYISAPAEGAHWLGATFQRGLDTLDLRPEDDEENIARLKEVSGVLAQGMAIRGGRAGLRTASQDRFPLAGAACDGQGGVIHDLYISTAHGSYGFVSTLAAAHAVADLMTGLPRSLPRATLSALDPARFAARRKRRGQRA